MATQTTFEVGGMGHSIKRKEDPRFIRGKGNYVDDIQLPGMLHMDIVRSPFAHAKIVKIDSEKALKVPGVLAVITGETLKQFNLHWMPTLMSDTQMVLPVEKVMYQSQEVAAVIATDRYTAAGGVEAVEGEYDPLPVGGGPLNALAPRRPGRWCCAPTSPARRTTASSIGRRGTGRARTRPSPRPTSSSSRTCTSLASTSRRSRRAAAWPTSTGSAASSPCI